MLHEFMAVIIRDKDELEAFARAADKKGYKFSRIRMRDLVTPIRISVNDGGRLSYCDDLGFELNAGIDEVREASDLFRNQLISIRRAKS